MSDLLLHVAPSEVRSLQTADSSPVTFTGFDEAAFATLERLRHEPHIEQYRREKDAIDGWIKRPFSAYRDDLVRAIVLPNALALETERNVFSRLLKNDFGRGGCHHHFWMSFYRPGRSRLSDLQLIHSMHPDAFYIGVSASDVSRPVLRHARRMIGADPLRFTDLVSRLISLEGWTLAVRRGDRLHRISEVSSDAAWLKDVAGASSIRILRRFERVEVLHAGGRFIRSAINAVAHVWPVYRFLLPDSP